MQESLDQQATPEVARAISRVGRASRLFSLSRMMIRYRVPGGWRLWDMLHRSGALDRYTDYRLAGPSRVTTLRVPLFRPATSLSAREIDEYDTSLVDQAIAAIGEMGRPAYLVDCGADIGMISSAFVRRCPELVGLLAFEPNPVPYRCLSHSAKDWGIEANIQCKAVGARAMRGRLVAPPADQSPHAYYMEEDETGPIEVVTVDSYEIDPTLSLIVKIDVEGAEREAVLGARESLRRAAGFVVIFEANPRVCQRTHQDPSEILRLLREITPIQAQIADNPDIKLDPDQPFFEQSGVPLDRSSDIVCVAMKENTAGQAVA